MDISVTTKPIHTTTSMPDHMNELVIVVIIIIIEYTCVKDNNNINLQYNMNMTNHTVNYLQYQI